MPDQPYTVQITKRAKRDLKPHRAVAATLLKGILALKDDPEAGKAKVGDLDGVRALDWRINKVEYRAAYVIHPEQPVCIVFLIGTRENFYELARHRFGVLQKALSEGRIPGEDEGDEEEA